MTSSALPDDARDRGEYAGFDRHGCSWGGDPYSGVPRSRLLGILAPDPRGGRVNA